jgi:hypothetical protein
VLADLTFSQAIFVAFIQAAGVLLGVLAGLLIGVWQARKAWERQLTSTTGVQAHERQIERDKLVRAERTSFYGRLVGTASEALERSSLARLATKPAFVNPTKASPDWSGAYAEAQIFGSPAVVTSAARIDAVLKKRWSKVNESVLFPEAHQTDEPGPPRGRQLIAQVKLSTELGAENESQVQDLIVACRDDIASLESR